MSRQQPSPGLWVCWPIKESNTTMVQASTLEQYSTSLQDPSLDRSSAHAISSYLAILLEEQNGDFFSAVTVV